MQKAKRNRYLFACVRCFSHAESILRRIRSLALGASGRDLLSPGPTSFVVVTGLYLCQTSGRGYCPLLDFRVWWWHGIAAIKNVKWWCKLSTVYEITTNAKYTLRANATSAGPSLHTPPVSDGSRRLIKLSVMYGGREGQKGAKPVVWAFCER